MIASHSLEEHFDQCRQYLAGKRVFSTSGQSARVLKRSLDSDCFFHTGLYYLREMVTVLQDEGVKGTYVKHT